MRKKWMGIMNVLLLCTATTFGADEMSVGVSADYFSKYIWRGQNLNDRSVFQPSVSLSKSGFTGSIWGSQEWTDKYDHAGEFTEFDYSLDYSNAVPGMSGVNFSVGTIHYRFPNTSFKPTTEVYGGLSFDLPLKPAIKVYRDVDEIDGSYVQFSLGHTIEKIAVFSDNCYCGLSAGASVGYGTSSYNKGYSLASNSQFNDLTMSLGLPVCYGKWTIKPSVNYSTMLSDEVQRNTAKSDNIWAGIGISRSF